VTSLSAPAIRDGVRVGSPEGRGGQRGDHPLDIIIIIIIILNMTVFMVLSS